MASENWDSESLCRALNACETTTSGAMAVELIRGTEDSLVATMRDFGDLAIVMSVGTEQILAQVLLWPVASVKEPAAFNAAVLRAHKLMPLSTFGIAKGLDDEDYYELFGALSATSKLENIVLELEVLAANAIEAAEAYGQDLR